MVNHLVHLMRRIENATYVKILMLACLQTFILGCLLMVLVSKFETGLFCFDFWVDGDIPYIALQ